MAVSEGGEQVAILNKVVRVDFPGKVTFQQKLRGIKELAMQMEKTRR